MAIKSKPPVVVILSGVWPGYSRGYEIANLSTLRFFSKRAGQTIYVGPAEEIPDPSIISEFTDVSFAGVSLKRRPMAFRFLKSMSSKYPAVTARFWPASDYVVELIQKQLKSAAGDLLFFYEDLPASYLLFNLKKHFPDAMHLVRSHNVMAKGFRELANQPNPLKSFAWRMELSKIDRFEKEMAKTADRFFAISEDDAFWYRQNMGIEPDGVAGFYLGEEYFKNPPDPAHENAILYLGSADLRKGSALNNFIHEVWPLVRLRDLKARLILGGRGTERFHNPSNEIYGQGFVQSVETFLNQGHIFLNPQAVGAGIKFKSLVAVASQKLLVSTSVGIEGTGLQGGVHCIVEDSAEKQASAIIHFLKTPAEAKKMAQQGREFVRKAFSEDAFEKQMEACIGEFF